MYNKETGNYSRFKSVGLGNQKIGDTEVAGTIYKDGQHLALSSDGTIILNSEEVAKSYQNIIKAKLDKTEKKAYVEALKENEKEAPTTVLKDQKKIDEIKLAIKDNAGYWNDDEEAFINFLEETIGLDPKTDKVAKKYLVDLKEYLNKNENNFNKESVRNKIVNKLVEDIPEYFIGEEKEEVKNPFEED